MAFTRRGVMAVAGGFVTGALSGPTPVVAAAAPARVTLRLLETSDLHMFVYDYDYYRERNDATVGLTKVASLIRAARAEAVNTLLFDNGDIIQGNPLGDYVERQRLKPGATHPVFRAMNQLGYDAATLGNHEFNYGLEFLDSALAGAKFPFVCANLDHVGGSSYLSRTLVIERDLRAEDGSTQRLRVGVIGFLPPQIMVWDKSKLAGKVTADSIVGAAMREVPALRAKCDVLVALCHSGISTARPTDLDENAAFHLAAVPGIDAILTGHSHRVFPGPDYNGRSGIDAVRGTLDGVPAVMPGFWGSHLGVIDLDLSRDAQGAWSVQGFAVAARPIYRREGGRVIPLAEDDPQILAAAAPEHKATIAWVGQPAGKLARPVTSYFALAGDDTVVSLVNAAQLWYVRPLLAGTPYEGMPLLSAAAPFKAGGISPDWYVDLAAGAIAIKDVADIYLYPNTVAAVRVTGAGLREWLERSVEVFNQIDPARRGPQELINRQVPSYAFDVISGLTWRVDLSQPPRYGANGIVAHTDAHRIVDLRYLGKPVEPDQPFVVVTNNFRADGGGRFPGLGGGNVVLRAPDSNRDVILRWIEAQGTIDPLPSGAWSFAKLSAPVTVAFDSARAASEVLADHRPLRLLGEGSGGYARFALDIG